MIKLRTFNNLLSFVVIAVGVFLIATPWIPQLELYWDRYTKEPPVYASNLLTDKADRPVLVEGEDPPEVVFPDTNRIVIPAISLDSEIFEGDVRALNLGPWKRPNTSTPDQGGNTVIAGHRFAYGSDGKWIFYHLDKLKTGDKIGIYWEGVEYIYQINDTSIVPPTAIEIEGPSQDDRLTIYTCTPLWTAENRLVVVADLIERNEPNAQAKL